MAEHSQFCVVIFKMCDAMYGDEQAIKFARLSTWTVSVCYCASENWTLDNTTHAEL